MTMAISDLQIALIGLGATAVAAVWGYNKWQERGHRRLAERILQGDEKHDALLGTSGEAAAGDDQAQARIEPGMGEVADFDAAADAGTSPWADPLADAIAPIDFAQPIAAPTLWAVQAEWSGHLAKPLHWIGLAEGEWRLLTAHDAGRYAKVAAALQLADRRGAMTEGDLAIFIAGVHSVATHLAGIAVTPEVEETLERARSLDEFCAAVDVQLAIHFLCADEAPIAGTDLRRLAEEAGLALGDDGRFHAADADGDTLYTLGNVGVELFDADSLRSLVTHGLTFSLDVPNVGQGAVVFDRMVDTARQLAQALGGTLVDAQRAPLTDAMIAGIRARIEEIQALMAARQIVAGGSRARRLFA